MRAPAMGQLRERMLPTLSVSPPIPRHERDLLTLKPYHVGFQASLSHQLRHQLNDLAGMDVLIDSRNGKIAMTTFP
jgi:hypothetical protein